MEGCQVPKMTLNYIENVRILMGNCPTLCYFIFYKKCIYNGILPPPNMSPENSRQNTPSEKEVKLSGRGEVWSYTTVRQAPTNFEEFVPYTVALIKLKEGPLISAQLTDLGDQKPTIGMQVEMVTRRLFSYGDRGLNVYGHKFRPLLEKRIIQNSQEQVLKGSNLNVIGIAED